LRGSTGKRTKKSDDRSRSKKRRSLIGGYQEGTWQNSSTDGEIGNMRGREKEDRTKTRQNGNIPWNEES